MTVHPLSALIWSPTYAHIERAVSGDARLLLIISPFIKLAALEQLLGVCKNTEDLKIIVRWAAEDLLAGASDVSIYPMLKRRNVQLFLHPAIHLKLFVFDSARAFHTSGNITARGLGLTSSSNIEVGCDVQLSADDWRNLYRILSESFRVDDGVYEIALKYVAQHAGHSTSSAPPLTLLTAEKKDFSTLSLPATNGPSELYAFYQTPNDVIDRDLAASCMHDLFLYDVPPALSEAEFMRYVRERFRAHPFIQAVVAFLQTERSARFGAMTEWLQDHCSDKPTPYRWELKSSVRKLYDWLEFGFSEISWNRPRHSMVIYWHETKGS